MGDIFSNVVGTMLEPIRDLLYASIGRQFGYLVHCKKNIKDLEDEVNKLKVAMGSVQTRVDVSLNNAEVIEDHVWRWLTDVQSSLTTLEEDNNILWQRTQNLKCLDVCTQYRLGKEGKKKKTDVTKLIEDGNFNSIAHRRPLTRTWHRTYSLKYEIFESRELVFKEIMDALKDDQCYKIGIRGMPGVGKTRMMKEVAQLAEKERFFDDIAEIVVTQNPNLKEIQQKLAEGLNLKLDKKTEEARKGLLRDRLKNGKKILVMIDDVWNDKIKLEDIGIPATDDRTQGCKILLTSRRQDVCEAMELEKVFPIGVLNEAEALYLFEKKVGDSFQTHGMPSIVEAVCRECAGLPLAILAVGGALKNKSKYVWEDALEQLRNASADNIGETTKELYSQIQLSYNYLQPDDAKSLFLLCCLFAEDAQISIDDLMRYGFGMRLFRGVDTMEKARNRAHSLVTILKTSSLLLEGSKEDLVKMHDIIRDVAISIASKEKDLMFLVKAGVEKWPEKDEYKRCSAISLRLNKDCVLPNDSECPKLRTLMLEGRYPPSEVPINFFDGMVKLEVLHLRAMQIFTLPSSLKNVRMLCLYDCKLVNVAFLGELRKLELLSIVDYFDLKELAPEIQQLTRLRLLDLRRCESLKILPSSVISSLSQLEELYVPYEFDKWAVKGNASLMELNSLTRLISLEIHVPNVELLPLNELLFKSLIRFKISIGTFFEYNEIHSSATRILKLVGFPLKRELNILMEKAEVVYLFELEGLKDVFHERHREEEGEGFLDLKYLKVKKCDGVEYLFGKPKLISQTTRPCASGSFSQLSVLKVDRCGSSYLFSAATARGLLQLQKLTIMDCEMLEEIVGDMEQEVIDTITFHQLKRMELSWLPNLRSFCGNTKKMSTRECNRSTLVQALFNDKVRFPALEKLKIKELKGLTTIWDNQLFLGSGAQDSFWQLRLVTVQRCEKLVNVIKNEEQGEEDSTDEIVFSQLEDLRLVGLPKLTSFCGANNAAFKFPSLKDVVLQKCPEVQTFASGGISTPPNIRVVGDDWRPRHVSELNKYVEQQYVGKGKGLQTVDNEDEGTSS